MFRATAACKLDTVSYSSFLYRSLAYSSYTGLERLLCEEIKAHAWGPLIVHFSSIPELWFSIFFNIEVA